MRAEQWDESHIPGAGQRYEHRPPETRSTEQRYDHAVDHITASAEFNTWKFANDFYQDNKATIAEAAVNIASANIDGKSMDFAIDRFAETSKVIIKGLDALAQVHPFIGAAVVAFKSVVTLDMTRRDNNKKVLAIKVDMQDMMSMLFQLRHMKGPADIGPDGVNRLQDLMDKIAKDVTECGSACDVYMKKSFLSKMIKSKIYEERLAGYATLFEENRAALMGLLSVHSALGVDQANIKLNEHGEKLLSVANKLDKIADLIHKQRRREGCIDNDSLLTKLLEQGGEPLPTAGDQPITGKGGENLKSARERLLKELSEDVDEVIQKNLVLFERKLEIQQKQLESTIREERKHILTTLSSGAHDRILNRNLREIWSNMEWKGSVKARHFVLALHDHYVDKFAAASRGLPLLMPITDLPGNPLTPGNLDLADQWVLDYLNVSHVQAILEAVDDDATGFISIKEVNTFTALQPDGWTLLQWIAYWAAGWHLSVSDYKNRIYILVKKLFSLVEDVLPANKNIANASLHSPCFWGLERLLRSTQSISDAISIRPELVNITKQYNEYEESRLEANLQSIRYELDTAATVALITGPGRIDRYVYPLLFLLLRHYVKAVDERIQVLAAVFRQTHLDIKDRLGNVAFGMFQLIFDGVERNPSTYSYFDWEDTSEEPTDDNVDATKFPLTY
ncbi:hypothetical protein BD779DRAFT_1674867 [Infundibulicybe gibba]|nr:hypothetical protein BD779DRAFT_1674867 [Infundibulicybe gibba]